MKAFRDHRKSAVVVAGAGMLMLIIFLLLTVGDNILPYGVKHFQLIEATWLSSEIMAWQRHGGKDDDLAILEKTNSSETISRYFTNIVVNGSHFEVVIKLEAAVFRNKGVLLGARDGSVIWLGRNGEPRLVRQALNK